MEVSVTGFDDLPVDLKVKFLKPLEPDTYCNLCQYLVPSLFRDPDEHWFCEGCVTMATGDGNFECPNDERVYPHAKLQKDETVQTKLRGQLVICPNSTEEVPVKIPFSALKFHLRNCSCGMMMKCPLCSEPYEVSIIPNHIVSECAEGSTSCGSCGEEVLRKDLSSHEATKHGAPKSPEAPVASAAHSSPRSDSSRANPPEINGQQERSLSRQASAANSHVIEEPKAKCPYCGQSFPKRSISDHIKRKQCQRSASSNDASNAVPLQASLDSSGLASPARTTTRDTEHFNGHNYVTSPGASDPHDMPMRLAKTERAVEDVKKQQGLLRQHIDEMLEGHIQSIQKDKDEVLKNIANLLSEFTEEQQRVKRQNAEQMEQLKETNEQLRATVAALSNDLEMVREELNALRFQQDSMLSVTGD